MDNIPIINVDLWSSNIDNNRKKLKYAKYILINNIIKRIST